MVFPPRPPPCLMPSSHNSKWPRININHFSHHDLNSSTRSYRTLTFSIKSSASDVPNSQLTALASTCGQFHPFFPQPTRKEASSRASSTTKSSRMTVLLVLQLVVMVVAKSICISCSALNWLRLPLTAGPPSDPRASGRYVFSATTTGAWSATTRTQPSTPGRASCIRTSVVHSCSLMMSLGS